ncbi:MAG: hypothetical protein VX904_03605, partial [Planctomycetota bacterium]|nr:hypothetical protein [Planctomycetota bacterium]
MPQRNFRRNASFFHNASKLTPNRVGLGGVPQIAGSELAACEKKKITKMRCEFVEVSLSPPCSRLHTTGILMALKSAALVYRLFT